MIPQSWDDVQPIVHRGWGAVTPHDIAQIAALWMDVARMRMSHHDQAGAMRAVRASVNTEWKPGWRQARG